MQTVDIFIVVCVIVFLVVALFLTTKRVSDHDRITGILAVPKPGKPAKSKRTYTKRSTYWSDERKKKAAKKASQGNQS